MRKTTALFALAALSLSGATAFAEDPADLVGAYTITSGEKFGKVEPKDKISGDMVRFSKDRVVVVDKNSKEIYGSTYKIDSSAKPWKITMTSKLAPQENTVSHGLIEKDGDTVKLIYALPGGETPTSFKTEDKQLMFIMKYKEK